MSWESSGVVGFDLGPLLQGQMRIAKTESAYNSLIIGPRGFGALPLRWIQFASVLRCARSSLQMNQGLVRLLYNFGKRFMGWTLHMIMCVLLCYPVSIHMSQLLSTGRPISSYLPPAGREIIKRIPCVCSCVIECVSRFYKGLYITLVVSPWPFQCFL